MSDKKKYQIFEDRLRGIDERFYVTSGINSLNFFLGREVYAYYDDADQSKFFVGGEYAGGMSAEYPPSFAHFQKSCIKAKQLCYEH